MKKKKKKEKEREITNLYKKCHKFVILMRIYGEGWMKIKKEEGKKEKKTDKRQK